MMKKICFFVILVLSFLSSSSQKIDFFGFQQFHMLFPGNRTGFGANFELPHFQTGFLRVGYAYQNIQNPYDANGDGWTAVITPDQQLHDLNIAYFFGKKTEKKWNLYYGFEFSYLLIRGDAVSSHELGFGGPFQFDNIYLGSECMVRYRPDALKRISFISNVSFGHIPNGTSKLDKPTVASEFSPVFRVGLGVSFDFRKID